MTFYEKPIVDKNSKVSEESVLAIKQIFLRKNGFIARDVSPDYGVDLEIEIIQEEKNATGNKFSVQIKSSNELKVITKKGINYISLEFETSRLGYLSNMPPVYGLIVLYDESQNIMYYDFVFNLISRISLQHGDDSWKDQGSVNINIPIQNTFDSISIKNIHKQIVTIFDNHNSLLKVHGKEFGIPVFHYNNLKSDVHIVDDIEKTIEYIDQYGFQLLDNRYYNHLLDLLTKLSSKEINQSTKFLFIAALTNYEIGRYLEADYYINKCLLNIESYSQNEKDILRMLKLKVEYQFGYKDIETYISDLDSLEKTMKHDINKLFVGVTIIYLKLILNLHKRISIEILFDEILSLLTKVKSTNIDETRKYLIIISLSTFIHQIGINTFIKNSSLLNIRKSLGIDTTITDRISSTKNVIRFIDIATKNTYLAYNYAIEAKDEFIYGYSLLQLCIYFFQINFFSLQVKDHTPFPSNHIELFKQRFEESIQSYQLFNSFPMLFEAYQALHTAKELRKLYKIIYNDDISMISEIYIDDEIKRLQKEVGINEFISIVDKFLINEVNTPSREETLAKLNEEEIDRYARITIEALNIPIVRIDNLKSELLTLKYFFSNRHCDELLILQDLKHTESTDTLYNSPLKYWVICKKCNIESICHENVEIILKTFDRSKCKNCS